MKKYKLLVILIFILLIWLLIFFFIFNWKWISTKNEIIEWKKKIVDMNNKYFLDEFSHSLLNKNLEVVNNEFVSWPSKLFESNWITFVVDHEKIFFINWDNKWFLKDENKKLFWIQDITWDNSKILILNNDWKIFESSTINFNENVEIKDTWIQIKETNVIHLFNNDIVYYDVKSKSIKTKEKIIFENLWEKSFVTDIKTIDWNLILLDRWDNSVKIIENWKIRKIEWTENIISFYWQWNEIIWFDVSTNSVKIIKNK